MRGVLLVDTGIWIALFERRERDLLAPSVRREILDHLGAGPVLVPWPTLYETVNTRFAKDAAAMANLAKVVTARGTVLLDDTPYRDGAREACFVTETTRRFSLVDGCLRRMLFDVGLRVKRFATFNGRDFQDVCRRRRIEIVPNGGMKG